MFTTATLTISAFTTDLRLSGDNWQRGQPHERINVLGDGGSDWNADYVAYFRRAADKELAERGYTRVGGWDYDAGRDVHVTAVTQPDAEGS